MNSVEPSPRFLHPDWPAPAHINAAVSTRLDGYSHGVWRGLNLADHCGDEPSAVAANRKLLADALVLPQTPRWLWQVHGTTVVQMPAVEKLPQADACWSTMPGVVCPVLTADCLPVLFCDVEGTVVAAAHAGWRGLLNGMLEATAAALPVAPQRLMAWLGPAIGPDAFVVGSEVRNAFVARDRQAAEAFKPGLRPDRFFADLYVLARQRLAGAGLAAIYGGGLCTFSDPGRFYSYRRDKITGRMASLIWLSASD